MARLATDILVVGGGAAGLSAALAASARAKVTVVDDNPLLGGQIWRAEMGKFNSPAARDLIDAVNTGDIAVINGAQIFAVAAPNTLLAETADGRTEIEFEKLIVATGARERFLPFPGWTLPNVFGVGGLQALVKGGVPVAGKRVVVAGTGPLLLAVADYLRSKRASVVAIAEQTSASRLSRFAVSLFRSPSKLVQAASLRARLRGVPYLTDCWVGSANGEKALEQLELNRKGRSWNVECDILACGFNLVPNVELAVLLGCEIADGCVAVDEFQTTSIANVFCAGEPTGVAGVESSLVEGRIAGLAATGDQDATGSLFAKRDKARKFGKDLNRAFALRDELKALADDDTIVCRCEDVAYGRLTEFENFRDAKLQTRCGMGPCQGRICGTATEFLFGWKPGSVRPPIFPVKMENL